MRYRAALGAAVCGLALAAPGAAQDWMLPVQAPPYSRVEAEGRFLPGNAATGEYRLDLPAVPGKNLQIRTQGPFGGIVATEVNPDSVPKAHVIASGVIANRDPNPPTLPVLPALCPRLKLAANAAADGTPRFVYQGTQDRLNHVPLGQMGDPDAMVGAQTSTVSEMDGRNVLLLKKIRLRYDYEDSNNIDYESYDPKTGSWNIVYEGMGGFYSNLHYAVIPYAPGVAELPRQELLHLAQGSLQEIGREDLRPALRTHAFLPGPFVSKTEWGYSLCEWGDTEYQAPNQELEYQGLALWDWDYSKAPDGHVLLVVWEEDEEEELRGQHRIPDHYLTDDLVGVFEIRREETLTARRFQNPRGDFEVTLQTGQLEENNAQ